MNGTTNSRRVCVKLPWPFRRSPEYMGEVLTAAELILRSAPAYGGTKDSTMVRWSLGVLAKAKRWMAAA